MKVSRRFNLQGSQSQLEFIDVDLAKDVALFVDPRALRLLDSEWAEECVALVQDFFRSVLAHIALSEDDGAKRLLRVLREPNETHLGLSRNEPRGHGLGDNSAVDVFQALSQSEAVKSGLLEDLEDTVLMTPGIGNDIISDITTNIIRGPLIEFTNLSCKYHNIPLAREVDSGPLWNPVQHQWESMYVELPVVDDKKLILVPKVIVRRRLEYQPEDYFNNYILEALREVELGANSELVELLRNGGRRVTKKALREKYGSGKQVIADLTRKNPALLERYRAAKKADPDRPLTHSELAMTEEIPGPDWDTLLGAVTAVKPGRDGASAYHLAVEALLQALFYPSLVNPVRESRLHEGRKRIDIRFTNASRDGFFWRIHAHHGILAGFVVVECKNYKEDIANNELDQLAGRFSPSRGQLGILAYRSADDPALCLQRCKDAFHDARGWILPIDDNDLTLLVAERKADPDNVTFTLLEERFAAIIS